MNKIKAHSPPKWADKLLEWYCRPSVLEDLQGDLYEFYEKNLIEKGPRKARIIYVLDVIKFMRPYTVKNFEIFNNLTQFIMFKNYFKTSVRSIARNKLFSAINVIGLAISMSICLIMITFLTELYSFDNFHENGDRMYRVKTTYQSL